MSEWGTEGLREGVREGVSEGVAAGEAECGRGEAEGSSAG